MKFKTLIEFISYCEEVCDNIDDQDEDFILLSTIASAQYINCERLLEDAAITLNAYYYWLKEAVTQEMYYNAAQIVTAKNCEIEHYIQLAQVVIPEEFVQFKYSIIELDTQINNKYLTNE